MRGMPCDVHFLCRRTAVLSRQRIRERTKALQRVQGKAQKGHPQGSRNARQVFGVRYRHNGALQACSESAGTLQNLILRINNVRSRTCKHRLMRCGKKRKQPSSSHIPLSRFLRTLARLLCQCTGLTFRANRGLTALHEHSGTATLVNHPVVDVVNPAFVQPLSLGSVVRFHRGTSTGGREFLNDHPPSKRRTA